MNLINKVSKLDGIEDYVLLSRESIERLVEGSKRLDDKRSLGGIVTGKQIGRAHV